MRISRERDPDDVDIIQGRIPRKLAWGLAKGVLMLGAAIAVTYGAASFLQDNARKQTQQAHEPPVTMPR